MTAVSTFQFALAGFGWLFLCAFVFGCALGRASSLADRRTDEALTDLPARLRVIEGGYGEIGAQADRVWPEAGDMAGSDGLGVRRGDAA